MNSEEKFKNLLKEKLGSQEFPFNPDNWDQARGMIDEARNKKRRILPFLFFGAGMMVLAILSLLFYRNTNAEHEKIISENKLTISKPIDPASDNADVSNDALSRKIPSPALNTQRSVESEKLTSNPVNNTQLPEVKTETNVNHISEISASGNAVNKSAMELRKSEKVRTVSPVPPPQVAATDARVNLAIKRNKIKKQGSDKLVGNELTGEPTPGFPGSKTDVAPTDKTEVNKINTPLIAAAEENTDVKNEKPAGKDNDSKTPDTIENTDVAVTPIVPLKEQDNTNIEPTPQEKQDDEDLSVDNHTDPKNIFSVEGGGSYVLGWNTNESKDARGINPVLGLNYLRTLSENVNVSIGLHYTTVGNLSNYSHESVDGRYSFGREGSYTVITPQRMQYLQAPLRFCYVLDKKSSIGAAYTFGYLLTVDSKVENYTQRLNSVSEKTVTKQKGYAQGFNSFDSQVAVFYRRVLFSDLSAHAEAFYGLADVKKNGYFKQNTFERNMGIKLTLIYNIFKR